MTVVFNGTDTTIILNEEEKESIISALYCAWSEGQCEEKAHELYKKLGGEY